MRHVLLMRLHASMVRARSTIVVRGVDKRDCARGASCAMRSPSINYMHPELKLTVIDAPCVCSRLLKSYRCSIRSTRSYCDSAVFLTRNRPVADDGTTRSSPISTIRSPFAHGIVH
jgi:hypothetical protein